MTAFAACLLSTAQAAWDLESYGDGIFDDAPELLDAEQDNLEGLDEKAEALYYDPKEGVIYEITTGAEGADDEDDEDAGAGATNEATISAEGSNNNFSLDQLLKQGLLKEESNQTVPVQYNSSSGPVSSTVSSNPQSSSDYVQLTDAELNQLLGIGSKT